MNQKKGPYKSRSLYNEEDETSRTLYVKINKSRPPNDLSAITNQHFKEHFQYFEEPIQRCNVVFHYDTGLPKGFGFVTFKSRSAASRAMDYFQGSLLGGRHKLDISFKLQKQASRPHHLLGRENTVTTTVKPVASTIRDTTIIEFKDEVIGLMMKDENGPLQAVASGEGVELCPLPPPRLGFQVKGKSQSVKVVKNYCNQLCVTMEQNSVGHEQLILNSSCQAICAIEVDRCRWDMKKSLNVVATCSFEKRVFYQASVLVTQNHVTCIRIAVGDIWTEQTDAIVIPTGRAVDNQHSYPIELASLAGHEKFRRLENTTRELVEVGETERLDGGELPCSYIIQVLYPLSVQKSEGCDIVICNSLSHAMEMNLGSIAFPGIKIQFIKSIFDGLCSFGSTSLHTVTVVLGTKFEAKRYEIALRNLVSSNTGVEVGVMEKSYAKAANSPNFSTTVPIGSPDFTWSWKENDGSFIPYSAIATDTLNQSYRDGKNMCSLVISGMNYVVNFTTMKQVNVSTHNLRDVIKNANPANEGSCATRKSSNPGLQTCIPWKYRDDFGRFMPYSPADSAKVEAMFQQQDESTRINIRKKTYRFDFKLMKQINVFTGDDWDVQRVVSPSLNDEVVRCKPVFLSDDKVVINLKGPRENLAEAKQQLERKIKALLFSKTIPLPANVPPSLHEQLQAIAKKHGISCTTGEGTASEATNVYQHALKLEGLESHVKGALTEVQELILQFQASSEQLAGSVEQGSQFPQEWDSMSERDAVKLIHLPMLAECQRVSQKFKETMSSAYVMKVQRVQNKELWRRYMQCMSRLHEKNAGGVNEKYLFHGTRGEPAEKICKSEEGFDMRFSREGMWGQANYFAASAHYSDTYSHHNRTNGTHELILAKVLTGDSYYSMSDRTLRMPPEKQHRSAGENQLQQVRYDSVNGKTSGSLVYMTYSNDRAYPSYIITYSRTEPVGYCQPAANPQPGNSQSSNVITAQFHGAQQPSEVLAHLNVPASVHQAHVPPRAQAEQPAPPPQPPALPPLVETAKQFAASIVSRVQKKAANKDKCKVS